MKNNNFHKGLPVMMLLSLFVIIGLIFGGVSMAQDNDNSGGGDEKLIVIVDVFSGRPNPSFEISDPDEILLLKETLGNLLPMAITTADNASVSGFGKLGYRGILITNSAGIEGIPSAVQILGDNVLVTLGNNGVENLFMDNKSMEKYYLGLAKNQGVVSQDLFDENIVPDPDTM